MIASTRKYRLPALLALLAATVVTAAPSPSFAQAVIRVAPPPLRHEMVPPPPPGVWVWQPGGWRWDGARYVWFPGRYRHPPHRRAAWIPPHWEQRGFGWVYIRGHWR